MAIGPVGRRLRAVWRLLRTGAHVLHGTWIAVMRFPSMDAASRHALIQWWAARNLNLLGVGLVAEGAPRAGAKLLVANHVSWLDILAIHAVCPEARFVSKADVLGWPVLGRLVAAAGTLFIQRERKRDALRVVHQMAESLQAGETVAVFPEGTTSEGHGLLPFHANLLQAAIATEVPVQPVALRYADAAGPVSEAVMFVGDTSLVQSLWWVACGEQITVRVQVLPAQGVRHADRRRLAERLRDEIGVALPV
jgi:1-acyl-sn-glycerol-3-phosphate acyltransferase